MADTADEWYYLTDGQERGPLGDDQLAQLVSLGQLLPTDLVWRNRLGQSNRPGKWVIANLIEGRPQFSEGQVLNTTVDRRFIGIGISTGDWQDQGSAQQDAIYWSVLAHRAQWVEHEPNVPDHQEAVAGCYFDLGLFYQSGRRTRQAQMAYKEALAIRTRLAQSRPETPGYQKHLAGSYNQLGLLYLQTGALDEGAAALQEAVAIRS